MTSRILSVAAVVGLAGVTLAGCVSEGGTYTEYRYVSRDDGYYWRDRDRWDHHRPDHGPRPGNPGGPGRPGDPGRPGRPDHGHGPGRPDRPDNHNWRNSDRAGPVRGGPDRGERNGLGHPDTGGAGRILPQN